MKKFAFLIILFCLSACSQKPSAEIIQTAIAQTQISNPTATYTFQPTNTATITATITPSPTATWTVTPTATFTATPDVRIIDVDPQKYLLKSEDLPRDGYYYIPNQTWMSINTNEEVISADGVEKGRDYVISTGRITGWWVTYKRGTRTFKGPDELFCFVGKFRTAQGAQLALTKYNAVETLKVEDWKYVTGKPGLGDQYIVYVKEKITSGGDKILDYNIGYTYRNFYVSIEFYGNEKDISHDFAVNVGKIVLKKLQDIELVLPPTITPTP